MVVGLGAGSTAGFAMRRLATLLRGGELRDVVGIPCSTDVEREARRLGIPLSTLEVRPAIDMTIDGADEVDPALNLIKGGGGALLREKIIAQASRREIIVVDNSKLSSALGARQPVPLEVVSFGWRALARYIESLGGRVTLRLRRDGAPFQTDQGNLILDCAFGPIPDPAALAARLRERAGVVDHGIFIGLATDLIVAGPSGVEHRTNSRHRG
jgi:ribose 5-phosphate isomerase A